MVFHRGFENFKKVVEFFIGILMVTGKIFMFVC